MMQKNKEYKRKGSYFERLNEYERSLIRAEIPTAKSNTVLANNLGLNRTTLLEKCRILGIFNELPSNKGTENE